MPGTRCVVAGCYNHRSDTVSFHKFPTDDKIHEQWIQNIQSLTSTSSDWIGPNSQSSRTAELVCSDHFTDECFT